MDKQEASTKDRTRNRRAQDHLDTQIVLIPRGFGFAAGCLLLCLAMVAYWALFGTISIKTSGRGMIVPKGRELMAVQSETNGRVLEILASEGDSVRANDPLIRLDQDDLDAEITEARNAERDFAKQFASLEKRLKGEVQAQEKSYAELQVTYTGAITVLEQNRDVLANLLSDRSTPQDLALGYRQQYQTTLIQLSEQKSRLAEAGRRLADLKADVAAQTAASQQAVNESRRTVEGLVAKRKDYGAIRAPDDGRIQEVRIVRGEMIDPETMLMTMSHGGSGFEVLAFLQPSDAKRVAVGMIAHVVPATVSEARFGTMRGRVTSISAGPVSTTAANTLLQDRQMAMQLSSEGLAYLARIALEVDQDVPSGFKWWTGNGPPFRIEAGTVAGVEIVLRDLPPVSMVIPAAKGLFRP